MRKTYGYFISALILLMTCLPDLRAQDTIMIPLKIKIGMEVSGPVIYYFDKNTLNTEGYLSLDLNEKYSAVLGGGYLNYKYSQYNYEYYNQGSFIRTGIDMNMLKPKKSQGRYWAGIGLHYGLSIFTSEVPSYTKENYWGSVSSSIPRERSMGHYVEFTPGVRAELFRNLSVGWTISIRKMISVNSGSNLKPIYMPGYGDGGKSVTTGLSYFIVWNIPYKKKQVIIKPEEPEETDIVEPTPDPSLQNNRQQQFPSNRSPGSRPSMDR